MLNLSASWFLVFFWNRINSILQTHANAQLVGFPKSTEALNVFSILSMEIVQSIHPSRTRHLKWKYYNHAREIFALLCT